MLTKADEYPIHQTPDPIAFSGTDRNFYDRYFFNGYSPDGTVFFGVALGVYPHLNIMDAGFSVRIGDVQYNLRASRHLHMERMDVVVGPIRIEVLNPLKRLRVVVDDDERGIYADLVFEGRHFPFEEQRTTRRVGPRILQDVTRMTQLGRYTGFIRVKDHEITFDEQSPALGVRDRSWGVRHVGERDPQPQVPAQELQVYWYWLPVHFDDEVLLFLINEDGDGAQWNHGLLRCSNDGTVTHLPPGTFDVVRKPESRWPESAVLTARDNDGLAFTVEVSLGANFFMSGLGYMHPEWSHGRNKGPLAIGYDELTSSEVTSYGPPHQHVQTFANVTLTPEGGKPRHGVGCLEFLLMGRHAPSGLTSSFDVP